MKIGALAGISICLAATFSLAQDLSDFGQPTFARDRSASGRQSGTPFSGNIGRISGTVSAPDGTPLFDVRVELHDIGNGSVVATSYTNVGGGFDFEMLPSGRYEVIANRAVESVREDVEVRDSSPAMLSLRLNPSDPNGAQSREGLVSIADLKVPHQARDAYQKAEKALIKHRPEDAPKYLQKALEIYPAYAPALTLRGVLSLDKNDLAAAVNDFDNAIRADSTYAMAYGAMASALNRLRKFDDALRAGERASSLSPNSWQAYVEMAKSYVGKADYQRALQQLVRAQGHLPHDYAPLHLLRANVLLGLENYGGAVVELKSFLNIAPNDPNSSAARQSLERINAFIASGTRVANTSPER